MLPAVRVTPLAYESLGVRGMCTLLETKEVGILADAGVAMGPRFRLMPHPIEYKARAKARRKSRPRRELQKLPLFLIIIMIIIRQTSKTQSGSEAHPRTRSVSTVTR